MSYNIYQPRGTREFRSHPVDLYPITSLSPYADNEVIGGLFTIAVPGPSGVIRSLQLVDSDSVEGRIGFRFFSALPTVFGDSVTFDPSPRDLLNLAGETVIDSYVAYSQASWGQVHNADLDINFHSELQTLYLYLVALEAITFSVSDALSLRLLIWVE